MKTSPYLNTLSIRVLTLLLTLSLSAGSLQAIELSVRIPAPEPPVKAVGLVMTPDKTHQIEEVRISSPKDSSFTGVVVSFDFKSGKAPHSVHYTAAANLADGTYLFGDVHKLSSGKNLNHYKTPVCEKEVNYQKYLGQVALLEQLIEVREKMIERNQTAVDDLLSPGLIKKLGVYEKVFGFDYSSKIEDISDYGLFNIRLSRILFALTNFHNARKSEPVEE